MDSKNKNTILMQGLISEWTSDIVNEYLVRFPDTRILVSTWTTENVEKINCEIIEINSSRTFFSIFKIRKLMIDETKKNFEKIIFISNLNYVNITSLISLINIKNIKVILTERSSISELKYSNNLINKYFQ